MISRETLGESARGPARPILTHIQVHITGRKALGAFSQRLSDNSHPVAPFKDRELWPRSVVNLPCPTPSCRIPLSNPAS